MGVGRYFFNTSEIPIKKLNLFHRNTKIFIKKMKNFKTSRSMREKKMEQKIQKQTNNLNIILFIPSY